MSPRDIELHFHVTEVDHDRWKRLAEEYTSRGPIHPYKETPMIERYNVKKTLLLTAASSALALILTYLISIPATTTDVFGHEHTPHGFTWAIYILTALGLAAAGSYVILEVQERIK